MSVNPVVTGHTFRPYSTLPQYCCEEVDGSPCGRHRAAHAEPREAAEVIECLSEKLEAVMYDRDLLREEVERRELEIRRLRLW